MKPGDAVVIRGVVEDTFPRVVMIRMRSGAMCWALREDVEEDDVKILGTNVTLSSGARVFVGDNAENPGSAYVATVNAEGKVLRFVLTPDGRRALVDLLVAHDEGRLKLEGFVGGSAQTAWAPVYGEKT